MDVKVDAEVSNRSPMLLTRNVAAALTAVDCDLGLTFRPLADQVNESLARERLVAEQNDIRGYETTASLLRETRSMAMIKPTP